MLKIDLGCGEEIREGFEGLDIRELPGATYVADARRMPFDDCSVDELNASRLVEYLGVNELVEFLREWHRVLKPGGSIRIETLDLPRMIRELSAALRDGRDSRRLRDLVRLMYGAQDHEYDFVKQLYDIGSLKRALEDSGFDQPRPLPGRDPLRILIEAQKSEDDIRESARRVPSNSMRKETAGPKILVESIARVFGDSLLSYPLTAIFKARYPGAHVAYAAGKIEKPLFEIAETVDEVTEKTVDNPSVPLNDYKYDVVLRGAFDVDEKWQPRKFIDGFDGPDGWDRVLDKGIRLKFNYPQEDIDRVDRMLAKSNGKKKVMLFIPTYRPNMSLPWEISGWDAEKYRKLINVLNSQRSDIDFYTFYSAQEESSSLVDIPNVTDLGRLVAYDEVLLFQKMDLLISTSTAVSAMIAPLVETPQIVIHTCEDDEAPVWGGIPNKCVLPQLRLTYLCSEKTTGEVISFIKPGRGGKLYEWEFSHYWSKSIMRRRMRSSHDVTTEQVAEETMRRLDNPKAPGKEWFVPQGESICSQCRLKQDYGICIYDFEPKLRNGLWMGENTGSVLLDDRAEKSKSGKLLAKLSSSRIELPTGRMEF